MKKTTLVTSLVLVLALLIFAGASCDTTVTNTNESTTNTNAATTDDNWTSSTSQGDIPDTAIAGTINDVDVTIATIQIDDWDDYYSWSFSTLEPDDTCGVIIGDDAVNFDSKIIQEGTFTKEMTDEIDFDDYHSYYHYEQDSGTPMSVNVDWAATVVVEEFDETNGVVTGWASFEFDDGSTLIEGSFEADLCE